MKYGEKLMNPDSLLILGSTKMYKDLKEYYLWPNIKRERAEFVLNYGICQQVKIEHQRPAGDLQLLSIPEWKWKDISMDFCDGIT
jgi:hypothetical protein